METRVLLGIQDRVGTPKITGMNLMLATSFNVKPETSTITSKVLESGRWEKDSISGRQSVGGDFNLQPTIDQIELLLQGSGFKKSGNAYKASPFEKYLTLIRDFPADGLHLQYEDCLVNTLTFSMSQEDYLSVTANVIGLKNKNNNSKYNTAVTKTQEKQILCYGAYLKDASNDISADVDSVEITISNSLEARGGLNTRHNTKIVQSGLGNVGVKINFNTFAKDNYLKAMEMLTNNKSVELILELREDIEGEGTKGRKLAIKMPVCKVIGVDVGDLEGVGSITKDLKALPNNDGDPIIFEITEKTV